MTDPIPHGRVRHLGNAGRADEYDADAVPDLLERARDWEAWEKIGHHHDMLKELCDCIEAQQREIDRLQRLDARHQEEDDAGTEYAIGLKLRAEAAERVVEAAELFVNEGTVLTYCNYIVQKVIEHKDKSDPHYKLCDALTAYREATK